MNNSLEVYLNSQVVFDTQESMFEYLASLPPYAVYRLQKVCVCETITYYQVLVYCFEDNF